METKTQHKRVLDELDKSVYTMKQDANKIQRWKKIKQSHLWQLAPIIIGLILGAIVILSFAKCNPEKKLQKAINKNGQKESVAYIVTHYPEYFKAKEIHDTIESVVTLTVEPQTINDYVSRYDFYDIFYLNKTIIKQNDSLKIELSKDRNGGIKIKAESKKLTATTTVTIPIVTKCPECPDIDKLKKSYEEESTLQKFYRVISWFFIIATIIILTYKYVTNHTLK